ncbi:MAG TPA: hypothetical protein VER96_08495 [Polyangiaceae bacterium]|nr:hypothetical protein [Polyangiaceae bacterium]
MAKPNQNQLDHRLSAKVSELRQLLMTAKDLDEVSEYFHNVLVPDDAFIASGERSSNTRLLTALQAVLERVAPEGRLGTPLIIRLDHEALCHGYTTWGRGHVVFFYFEQLDLGFCSYSRNLFSAEVTLLRFNLTNAGVGAWGARQNVGCA